MMVGCRQDPGLKGNGVWYSLATVEGAELPLVPLPEPVTTLEEVAPRPTSEPVLTNENADSVVKVNIPSEIETPVNPLIPIAVGLIPVAIMIFIIVWKTLIFEQRNL